MTTSLRLTRRDQPELLDLGHGSLADVHDNLAEMWHINRRLGGFRALTRHLYPRLKAWPGPLTIADLGTGSAEALAAVIRWARRHDLDLTIIAVDWAERNLDIARTHTVGMPEIRLLRADANRLPFPPQSVDYVISSLFLHHFAPDPLIGLLRSAAACARRGVIMSDLVRGWLPLAAFKLVGPIFARNFLTRHDGALSIRRAYIPEELCALAGQAGLTQAVIHTHWPWRMTLVADR